jgi:hypothetical protein
MSAVTPTPPTRRRTLGRLRTAAIVAALACVSNGAHAAFASVVIDGLSVTPSGGNFLFAPTDIMSQAWDLRTFSNLAQTSVNTGSQANWNNVTQTASSTGTSATVASLAGNDPSTQQPTPAFTLSANATTALNVLREATGTMFESGGYCFYDPTLDPLGLFDGTSRFCNGSGSIDFVLQYDLVVTKGIGGPPTSAYAELDVDATGLPAGFFDIASTDLGLASVLDQQLIWSAILGVGDPALLSLAGTVVVQATPEPGVLTLLALGLVGVAATRRRSTRTLS